MYDDDQDEVGQKFADEGDDYSDGDDKDDDEDGQNEDDHDFRDEEDVDGDQSVTYRYQEFIFLVVSEKFGTSKKSRNR